MPVKHPPQTRRERAFSSLALLSAGALLTSSTILGLSALGRGAADALAQFKRRPAGAFTQAPTKAFLGLHPGRDPHGRGMWSAAQRAALVASTLHESEWAAVDPQGFAMAQHSVAVAPEPGASQPWEGSSPSAGGSVNTGNGDKITQVHLLNWKVRGGGNLDFTLYHNSQTNYSDELGAGWTWTYDCYINNLTSTPTVHWGDGTSIPYSASGGSGGGGGGAPIGNSEADADLFADADGLGDPPSGTTYTPPAGIHDALTQNADGTWTVTKKDGTLYAFNAAGFLTQVTDRNGTPSVSR